MPALARRFVIVASSLMITTFLLVQEVRVLGLLEVRFEQQQHEDYQSD